MSKSPVRVTPDEGLKGPSPGLPVGVKGGQVPESARPPAQENHPMPSHTDGQRAGAPRRTSGWPRGQSPSSRRARPHPKKAGRRERQNLASAAAKEEIFLPKGRPPRGTWRPVGPSVIACCHRVSWPGGQCPLEHEHLTAGLCFHPLSFLLPPPPGSTALDPARSWACLLLSAPLRESRYHNLILLPSDRACRPLVPRPRS